MQPHDLGGALLPPGQEALDLTDRQWSAWERTCHGVVWLLVQKGLMSLDELRRATEALPGYESLDYYSKWAAASAAVALERGTFTREEWDAALGPDPSKLDTSIRFKQGDLVRVRPENAAIRWRRPHLRTPGYINGLVGTIERPCMGLFGDPELKAFREEGPKQPLYRVRFRQADVWELYDGSAADTLDVEVYQPWLEPATQQQLQEQQDRSSAVRQELRQQQAAPGGASHDHDHHHHHHHHHEHHEHHYHDHERHDGHHHGHDHGRHHGHHGHAHEHSSSHAHDHGDHVHEERCQVEQNAVDLEGDDTGRPRVAEALQSLLLAKGILTAEELRREVEAMDARGRQQEGPRLVARAWLDPAFKARLLQDTAAAAAELGISTSNFSKPAAAPAAEATAAVSAAGSSPAQAQPQPRTGTVLTAVENSAGVHNLVVCTLCSCYPLSVLGLSPPWYRSRAYRARAVRDPRGLLAEFGTVLPEGTAIRVHDSTADLRYVVIPARPAGTEGWSEEQLMRLVTRDSMIGVATALDPSQLQEQQGPGPAGGGADS